MPFGGNDPVKLLGFYLDFELDLSARVNAVCDKLSWVIYLHTVRLYVWQIVFGEDSNGNAYHVMGIVHDAARYLPDLLDYMAEHYPSLTVKNGVLGRSSDIETTTMAQYKDQVSTDKLS